MMVHRRSSLAGLVACAAVVIGVGAAAAAPPAATGRRATTTRVASPARALTLDNARRIDVNSINMWVTNFGSFAYDLSTGNAGLVYPKGTQKTAVFASGIWLGAQVAGETRVTVGEYSQEFGPGIMQGGTFDDASKPVYRTYKVVRWTGDPNDSAHVTRTADETAADPTLDPLAHHSWSEYMAGAVPYGAPWKYYRLPDTSTPAPDDSVDVPGPDVLGDQMLWCVYNDADASRHTNSAGLSAPLGVEVQQTTFAFNRQGALGNTLFLKFRIINKGANTLDNMYVSLWSDPDLGGATDDLVGCDTTLSLGYVYNANNNDQLYLSKPPAVGYDFFKGPTVGGQILPLTSFNKYINGTDPASPDESYNYMQGLLGTGDPLTDPDGNVTNFFYPGDPVVGTGWLDSNPADRRFMLSSGPFTMAPGDTQEVVGAIIIGQGNDRLSSISSLKFNDTFAQDAFNKDFILPSPPPQPKVDVDVDHGTVVLSWDTASRLNYNEPGYAFEGYNVYQGATVAGPWTRLATYDEINSIRVIFDEVFDVTTGQTIPQFPVQFGSDAGVRFSHTVTQDAVRGGPLHDGTEYFFAVTAYSYDPAGLPKTLENAQVTIRATPQREPGGTNRATASATPVAYSQYDTSKPPATDVVEVTVVNPELVTGDAYRIGFTPNSPPYPQVGGQDVLFDWWLYDVTKADTLLTHQVNKTGDEDYQIIDGLKIKVIGAYVPQLQDVSYVNANTTNRRALTGVNWGGIGFFGGADTGWNFWGGSLDPSAQPDSFATVEVRFSTTATQKAYRYLRLEKASDGGAPPQGRSYLYGGYRDCNFQVWDTVNNRQLQAMFVERCATADDGTILPPGQQPATFDSTWAPDASDDGSREYLLLNKEAYSDTPNPAWTVDDGIDDPAVPILYGLWSAKRADTDVIDDGDLMRFLWANPAISNDVYDFSTTKLARFNAALEKGSLKSIRVVPNPYYTRSAYELNQFARVVRFINMPERCTVRIFNLAGDLVRTLQKTDATSSILEWDLQTTNRLPVGSGVYIYHVDVPGVGSTFGRMAVIMEQERLNNF